MYAVHRLLIPKTELPHSLAPVVNGMIVDTTFRSYGTTANAVTADLVKHLLANYMPKEEHDDPELTLSIKERAYDVGMQVARVAKLIEDVELVTVSVIDPSLNSVIDKALSILNNAEVICSTATAKGHDRMVLVRNTLQEIQAAINYLFTEEGVAQQRTTVARLDMAIDELHGYLR